MPSTSPWWRAARPLAHVHVGVPLALGQALAFARGQPFDPGAASLCLLFGGALHAWLVFGGPRVVGRLDRRGGSDGEAGSAADGSPSAEQRQRASWAAAAASVACAGALAWLTRQPGLLGLPLVCGLLLWAYDRPPLRLVQRGRGELVQGLGLGVVLPIGGWLAQGGALVGLPWGALVASFFLAVAGHVASAILDEPTDRRAGVQSYAVRFGGAVARRHCLELTLAAAIMTPLVLGGLGAAAWLALIAWPAGIVVQAWRLGPEADKGSRPAVVGFVAVAWAAILSVQLAWIVGCAVAGLLRG